MTDGGLGATLVLALTGLLAGAAAALLADRFWPRGATAGAAADTERSRGRGVSRIRLGQGLAAVSAAALFVLLGWRLSPADGLIAWLFYAASGILLTLIDVRHRLLPNRVLAPVFVASLVLLTVTAGASGDWPALGRALVGAAVLFVGYLILALISPAGMGMGDVKFAAIVGLMLGHLGWHALLVGTLAGFIVGALMGLVTLALRRGGNVPFGPAMYTGSFVAVFWADAAARSILLP